MDEARGHAGGAANPAVGHERNDVNVRGILIFGGGLLVLAGIIHLLMWWLFDFFAVREAALDRPLSPLTPSQAEHVPPEPRLQISPTQEMREMWAAEDAVLQHYGWVDRQAGVVRIPVERAMQLLAERGLPAQPAEGGQGGGVRGDDAAEPQAITPGPPEGFSSGRTREGRQP